MVTPDAYKRIDFLAFTALKRGFDSFHVSKIGTNFSFESKSDLKYLLEVFVISWKQQNARLYYGALTEREINQTIDKLTALRKEC